jgi:hypothetical protein
MPRLYRFSPEAAEIVAAVVGKGSPAELRSLLDKLKACECIDRQEEIRVLLAIIQNPDGEEEERVALQKRILWLLRKFAHRKYRDRFERTMKELRALAESDPVHYAVLMLGLNEVAALARARFEG